jgi:hypothetical protein
MGRRCVRIHGGFCLLYVSLIDNGHNAAFNLSIRGIHNKPRRDPDERSELRCQLSPKCDNLSSKNLTIYRVGQRKLRAIYARYIGLFG